MILHAYAHIDTPRGDASPKPRAAVAEYAATEESKKRLHFSAYFDAADLPEMQYFIDDMFNTQDIAIRRSAEYHCSTPRKHTKPPMSPFAPMPLRQL